MSDPNEVVSVRIVRRTTHMDRQTVRPKAYEFSDIFIVTADGQSYYSRTWDILPDTAHERAAQLAAFKRRREAAGRAQSSLAKVP